MQQLLHYKQQNELVCLNVNVVGMAWRYFMKLEFEIALGFFFWGLETFSRRDCGLILAGYRDTPGGRRLDQLLERWRRQQLITRHGRGKTAEFTITERGRSLVPVFEPHRAWNKPWDSKWRVFSFDLPADRRKDRTKLWRALHDAKLGCLQHSVWIWPHEVEALLREVIQARGIPECFCGFEASRLFLCDHAEVAATAWDFDEISRRHATYLRHLVANPSALLRARDLTELARFARIEHDAYRYAFSRDPLMPRVLWPKSYSGAAVEERHQNFCAVLQRRLHELCSTA
jgi:DNA-binding transcriptional regulator PaaX